ncbi:MAG: glycosyltransferase family 1 protein [Phycisphaerales bacterium]|nr:glycosyltransferase family 1 protein [Phycisphaerales bacterium]
MTPDRTDPERPTRVCVFTDTLADINGVCRFIQNIARTAHSTGRDLRVLTSTRLPLPDIENVVNFEPGFAMKMPRYETLDLALPPAVQMIRYAEDFRPDVIHLSTPGPIGTAGMIAAKMMRVPIVGVYHTDFPAYVEELFQPRLMTTLTNMTMSGFYRQFVSVFSRSADYAERLVRLGIDRKKLVRLTPGFDNEQFSINDRDPSIWDAHGVPREAVKVLFCGRVSTEKNLPMLANIWPEIEKRAQTISKDARLIIIGDGPYRKQMEHQLGEHNAHFLGFRHGKELATLYSSCDLFAFPSTTDTLGQVVMESQASGLPVIITDEGGPKEVVRNNETGIIVPIADREGWIETISGLIADDDRRKQMGHAGVEAMKDYSFQASFEHYWQVHERARFGLAGGE